MRALSEFCENLALALERAEHQEQVALVLMADAETGALLQDIKRALKAYEAGLDAEHDCWRNNERN